MSHVNSIYANSIHADSTNIKTKNQHDMYESSLLHKIMSWDSHDTRASTIYAAAQASTCSTRTTLTYNNVSSVRTQYLLPVPNYGTNNPTSPSYA